MRHLILIISICFFYGCENNAKKKLNAYKDSIAAQQLKDSIAAINSTSKVKNQKLTYSQAYDQALTLWPIPFEEIDVITTYGKAHVIVCGSKNAKPLILLHGMNASSTMWYPNIKSLSEHHRIYAIDFFMEPGKSVCLGEVENTHEIVNWYYQIFDQLDLKKIDLLGASRGGWLALNIALRSPSRINKIGLLSPAQTFYWITPGSKIITNIAYSVSPKRKNLKNVLETMTVDIEKINQRYINQYYIATQKASMNKCFLQMQPFSDNQLKSLNMPILLLIGDNDIINSDKSLRRAKNLFSNVQTCKIKNSGHFLSIDQPEIVNKKLIDFFN